MTFRPGFQMLDNEALDLIGPDNQKSYALEAGKLVAVDAT